LVHDRRSEPEPLAGCSLLAADMWSLVWEARATRRDRRKFGRRARC
jgi:hypothetical protein